MLYYIMLYYGMDIFTALCKIVQHCTIWYDMISYYLVLYVAKHMYKNILCFVCATV